MRAGSTIALASAPPGMIPSLLARYLSRQRPRASLASNAITPRSEVR
jgi:hypothetical protein